MIGVIGGNGVAATNLLCKLIEERLTQEGAFRDAHHPEMIIWQATSAPSRSMFLEGKGPSWLGDYVDIGRKLKSCGCSKLCMCCNTAHYAIDFLSESIGLPFFNLLELVVDECRRRNVKKIGMMCSDGLRKVKLYDKTIESLAPMLELVYPDENYQKIVTLGICNSKNKTRFEETFNNDVHPYNCFSNAFEHLLSKGVDCIVAGCTDIRNVFRYSGGEIQYIDSLEVLAEAIVQHYKAGRKRI